MIWRKLSDGSELLISFELAYHFEVFHSVCHCFFIALFWNCFMAEMLTRRGLHLRNVRVCLPWVIYSHQTVEDQPPLG